MMTSEIRPKSDITRTCCVTRSPISSSRTPATTLSVWLRFWGMKA